MRHTVQHDAGTEKETVLGCLRLTKNPKHRPPHTRSAFGGQLHLRSKLSEAPFQWCVGVEIIGGHVGRATRNDRQIRESRIEMHDLRQSPVHGAIAAVHGQHVDAALHRLPGRPTNRLQVLGLEAMASRVAGQTPDNVRATPVAASVEISDDD